MSQVILHLTPAEAKALHTLAGEGFQGIATDKHAALAYLGGKRGIDAAGRAIEKLSQGIDWANA